MQPRRNTVCDTAKPGQANRSRPHLKIVHSQESPHKPEESGIRKSARRSVVPHDAPTRDVMASRPAPACQPAARMPLHQREIDVSTASRLLANSQSMALALLMDGHFSFANSAFTSLFAAQHGVTGMTMAELLTRESRAQWTKLLADRTTPAAPMQGTARRLDGSLFDIEIRLSHEHIDDAPIACVMVEDISWRQLYERHLKGMAYADALTGLPNRAHVMDALRNAVQAARIKGSLMAVLMADLDGLKRVNDTLGHQTGDIVLQVLSDRFRRRLRRTDVVARLGGDEFCIVLPRIKSAKDTHEVASRLVAAAREPIVIDGREICVGVSAGIALFPEHGSNGDSLIAVADAALYDAKRTGRNRYSHGSAENNPEALALPLIQWSVAHELGVAMLDRQHRKLTEHVNDLVSALKRGDGSWVISDLLTETMAYAEHHFHSEERLMDRISFRDGENHRSEHARALEDLRNFSTRHNAVSLSLATRFLHDWLMEHIRGADRQLATALKAEGIT